MANVSWFRTKIVAAMLRIGEPEGRYDELASAAIETIRLGAKERWAAAAHESIQRGQLTLTVDEVIGAILGDNND